MAFALYEVPNSRSSVKCHIKLFAGYWVYLKPTNTFTSANMRAAEKFCHERNIKEGRLG